MTTHNVSYTETKNKTFNLDSESNREPDSKADFFAEDNFVEWLEEVFDS